MQEFLSFLEFGNEGWGDEIIYGALLTIALAVATLPFGIILGFIIALAKHSNKPWQNFIGNVYSTIFRGLPEFLTLLIVYYSLQTLIQNILFFTDLSEFQISSFSSGVVALSLVFAAFSSEVILGALKQIDQAQTETARTLAMNKIQIFLLIILPQLWRHALPGLGNTWLVLLKDTALVSVIGLEELMRVTGIIVGVTKKPFFFYLLACVVYLIIAYFSQLLINFLERKSNRGYRMIND